MIIFEPVVSVYVFHTTCLYIPKICMSFGIFQRPSPMELLNRLYLLFFLLVTWTCLYLKYTYFDIPIYFLYVPQSLHNLCMRFFSALKY